MAKKKGRGWHGDSKGHSLAAKRSGRRKAGKAKVLNKGKSFVSKQFGRGTVKPTGRTKKERTQSAGRMRSMMKGFK